MAAKIKDGLFIGDADSAADPEFLDLNKIVNLGNLAAREVPNRFSAHGLVYFSLNWQDHPDFVLFDQSLSTVVEIVSFVDTSLKYGQSVLLFSTRGVGRCAVAACVYLMYKYRWGFEKSYDYIISKKPDIDINRGFVHQLFMLDKKLTQMRKNLATGSCSLSPSQFGLGANAPDHSNQLPIFAPMSGNADLEKLRHDEWNLSYIKDQPSYDSANDHEIEEQVEDELLLIHSYVNSKNTITAVPGPYPDALRQSKNFVIKFNPDLYLNHLYEEPGGRYVTATSLSSGRQHPPLPRSPTDKRHGSSHGPGHRFGILKGGKHHSKNRRNDYDRDGKNAMPPTTIGFESTRSIGFDSPPRNSTPLSSGGWASPEQRLHDILDDLSNQNADPSGIAPDSLPIRGVSRPKPRPKTAKSGSRRGHSNNGELTDTSDEGDTGPPFANISDVPNEGESKTVAVDRQRDLKGRDVKGVRSESKSTGISDPGFKESNRQGMFRPSGEDKRDRAVSPSLYELANMNVTPAYQQPTSAPRKGVSDADFEIEDAEASSELNNGMTRHVAEHKGGARSSDMYGSRPQPTGVAETKQASGSSNRNVRGQSDPGNRVPAYLDDESDIGQHSMLTGGGTIEIEADDDDDMYEPTANSSGYYLSFHL